MESESSLVPGLQELAGKILPSAELAAADLTTLDPVNPNLMTLSILIDTFGGIHSATPATLPPLVLQHAWALDRLATKILMEETREVAKALELASQLCSALLQDLRALAEARDLPAGGDELSAALSFLGETPPDSSEPTPSETSAPLDEPASEAHGKIDVDDTELMGEFVFESNSHLDSIEEKILELENRPDDLDLINEVFRPFHSMKGGAGFLNLKDVQSLAHETETLLDRCRKQQLPVSAPVIDLTLQSVDLLKQLVSNAALSIDVSQGKEIDEAAFQRVNYKPLVQRIQSLLNHPEDETQPPRPLGQILLQGGAISQTDLDQALLLQGAPLGEILIATGAATPDAIDEALEKQRKIGNAIASAIKVDTDKLDMLVNLVGELVIAHSLVAQSKVLEQVSQSVASNQWFYRNLSHLGKITKAMQDEVMLLRMMPLKQTFQKMNRLVRDLSKEQNKMINFVTTGEETELDKNVIEQIGDPLVHILRNSLDHGIETVEERRKAGKVECGTIRLTAGHRGDRIVISISDDGRGLPREKLVAKAIAAGVISPGESLTDSQICNLAFLPGVSTADKVSNISGRGVGMDVVKRNIEHLRGRVELESVPGRGTTLTLSLPLTLAIIDGLVIRVGEEQYILPTAVVVESIRPQSSEIQTVIHRGEMLNLRGELLPFVRLHDFFKIGGACTDPTRALVVIVEAGEERLALLVDDLMGQQQVVLKNLGRIFSGVKSIAGAAILGHGRVGLIIDVEGLVLSWRENPTAWAGDGAVAETSNSLPGRIADAQ